MPTSSNPKVLALKALIAKGAFKVDAHTVASRMLEDVVGGLPSPPAESCRRLRVATVWSGREENCAT